ncbi:MAG: hypothetical protein CMH54_15500 [Myxococcales bacterium]|nr:hypothetical protein [Myxococcales bacterium]
MKSEPNIREAISVIKNGGLVLHPTGGLWGLAADPYNEDAVDRLRLAKWVPPGPRPFVILIESGWLSDVCDIEKLPSGMVARILRLVERFWPGGLTLILPASESAPRTVCVNGATGPTIAVRCDDHPAALALCKGFGKPLISTSSNRTGQDPPGILEDVDPGIRAAAFVVDSAPPPSGQGSTIVDVCTPVPQIRRSGRVPAQHVLELLGRPRQNS